MNAIQRAPTLGVPWTRHVHRCAVVALLLATAAAGLLGLVFADETAAATEEGTQADLIRQIEELRRLLEETKKLNEQQNAQLRERIAELEQRLDQQAEDESDEDLAELLAEAEELTSDEAAREDEIEAERKSAKGLQRSLQSMNPEISFIGDVAYEYTAGEMKDGFRLLGAELGLQAALDPYTRFKAFLGAHQEPFELELEQDPGAPASDEHAHGETIDLHIGETYMEWVGLPTRLRLTVGKFRQQYGTLNRWHLHALPTAEMPFALRNTFGDMGLVGIGVGLYWQLPRLWASSNSLTLQVTNADNPIAFAGADWQDPAFLLRHTGFFDLGPSSYFDLGLNAVWGANDETGDNKTLVAGIDFNFLWEPVQRARYRSVELRGEWIHTRAQDALAPTVDSDSFYTYLTVRLNRRWSVGFRFDHAELPFDRYHLYDPDSLEEIAFREGLHEVAVTPYLTFWQSEFVRLRLQYQRAHRDFVGAWGGDPDDKVWLQATFGAGPHKHEEY